MTHLARVALLGLFFLGTLRADILWDGSSSSSWRDAKNWNLNRLPSLTETLVFPEGISRKAMTQDIANPLIQKLVFKDDGYSLSGAAIRLAAGGIELVDSTNFAGTATVNANLQIVGTQTFFVGGEATVKDPHLVLNGDIQLSTFPLTLAGGAVTVSGDVTAAPTVPAELHFRGFGKTVAAGSRLSLPDGLVTVSLGDLHLAGELEAREVLVRSLFFLSRFTGTGVVAADFLALATEVSASRNGDSFGRLTFERQTTLGKDSRLLFRLGTPASPGATHDQIRIAGSLLLQDNAEIVLEPGRGFAPALGQTFVLIDKTSAGNLSGRLRLPEGTVLKATSAALRLSHSGGDGNDVTATVVDLVPTMSKIENQTLLEDSVLEVPFTLADPNTAIAQLAVTASSPNATVTVLGTGSSRRLRIQPEAHFFDTNLPVTVSVTDGVLTATQTFNVQVTPVNDAPSFNVISPLSIVPNLAPVTLTAAQAISVGPGEATQGQKQQFEILANSNPELFLIQPSLAADGRLTCTPLDVEGTALLTVRAVDDGGTALGGVNASTPQQIELQVAFPPIPPVVLNTTAWTGNTGDRWDDPANWSSNQVPGSGNLPDPNSPLNSVSFPAGLPAFKRTVNPLGGAFAVNMLFQGDDYTIAQANDSLVVAGNIEVEAGNHVDLDLKVIHALQAKTMVLALHRDASLRFRQGLDSDSSFLEPISPNSSGSIADAFFNAFAAIFVYFQFGDPVGSAPLVNKNLFFMFEEGAKLILERDSHFREAGGDGQDIRIAGGGTTVLNGNLTVGSIVMEKGSRHALEINGRLDADVVFSRNSTLRGADGQLNRVFAGGRIQPGREEGLADSTTQLTFDELHLRHDSSTDARAVLEMDLGSTMVAGSTYDQIRVTTLSIAEGVELVLRPEPDFALVPGQEYLLVEVAGTAGGRTGTFAGLPEGGILNMQGAEMRLSYFGGDGNDITATVANQTPVAFGLRDLVIDEDALPTELPVMLLNLLMSEDDFLLGPSLTITSSQPQLLPADNVLLTGTTNQRTLKITPLPEQNGSATVDIAIDDGTAVGTNRFKVTVRSVNDAPSFLKGPDVIAARTAGAQKLSGWATAIRAGPANENTQALAFEIVSNSNPGLFAELPAVETDGTLSFAPNPKVAGTATLGLRLIDDGGTERGGQDRSAVQAFTLTTLTTNTPPSFTTVGNVRVTAGQSIALPWATVTSKGAADEDGQTVSFLAETDRTELFVSPPAIDAAGVLSLQPLAGAGGQTATLFVRARDNGGTQAGGVDTSPAQSFKIQIEANAPPEIFGLLNQTLAEDATTQVQSFRLLGSDVATPLMTVTSSRPELIPTESIVLTPLSFAGTLAYTPLPNASGSATLTLSVDDGQAIATASFVVTVTPVNDAPAFTAGPDLSVARGSGPQVVAPWATDLRAGPEDEDDQALAFEITGNSNPGIFLTPPTVNAAGMLSFTPNPETSGSSMIQLRLRDDGGTENGGVDASAVQSFTLTTLPTNNAPRFTPGPPVEAPAGVITTQAWASNLSPGAADEIGQALSFIVAANRPDLFSTPPSLSATGELSLTPLASASGVVTLTVQLQDDGGTANGGIDRSPVTGITVRIGNVARTPGTYIGLAEAAPQTTASHARQGFLSVKVTRPGSFTGKLLLGGISHSLRGTFDNSGIATFGRTGTQLPLPRKGLSPLQLSLRFDAVAGSDQITGTVLADGQSFAQVEAERAIFHAQTNPMLTWIVDGQGNQGRFTVAFPVLTAPNRGLPADAYPQGDGWGGLSIGLDGKATLVGQLADGSKITASSFLTEGNRVAFHALLQGGKGSISGRARYQNLATSDADGTDFLWFRPAQTGPRPAALYPNGWPGGIEVDFEASRLVAKAVPYLPALTPAAADGNLLALFDALPPKALNLNPRLQLLPAATPDAHQFKATVQAASGRWSGSFVHPANGKKTSFQGVLLQKSGRATGFFLGPTGSGLASFRLAP